MKYFICFILLFLFNKCFTQSIDTFYFKETEWDAHLKNVNIFNFKSQHNSANTDSVIVLHDGTNLSRWVYIFFNLFNENASSRHSLNILAGIDSNDSIVIIKDQNNNLNFSDDNIVRYSLDTITSGISAFYAIPAIMDSVTILHENKKESVYINALKIVPAIKGQSVTGNIVDDIQKSTVLSMNIYLQNYYSSFFSTSNNEYEICLKTSPLLESLMGMADDINPKLLYTGILIYQKNRVKDSLIYFNSLIRIQQNIGSAKYFKLDSSTYEFTGIDLANKSVSLKRAVDTFSIDNIVDSLISGFDPFAKKRSSISIRNKPTLLMFTGSWCAPCKESLPFIKSLYEKQKDHLQIVLIDKEQSANECAGYKPYTAFGWHVFYENLSELKTPLVDKFNVSMYPTFILIDKNGKILYKKQGVEGASLLLNKFR
ncbi:MAG TPA: TlpA disulfide reductase family protein [Parafilimonas sp.]|nr:TlpA disulfide reductase family protein [Parafilimonas sp.]